ncbi:phiSA1p31-related protein [Streptomyces roseus]|uniref:phiSA1p31-related protein n=1 Tax=Streptomyces roseus TaxID=66430 RepID=UPI0033F1FA37
MTFKVGDEVEHRTFGRGTIAYGPYLHTTGPDYYLMVQSGGTHSQVLGEAMTAAPKFTIGDEVRNPLTGIRGPIVAGPFVATGDGERYWIVEQPDGSHSTPREDGLTKVEAREIKVGDRVRVTEADGVVKFVGRVGVVAELDEYSTLRYLVEFGDGQGAHGDDNGQWWCNAVEPTTDTYEHDGVTYDLSAKYRDKDGDVWRFECLADGSVRGTMGDAPIRAYDDSLRVVVEEFGPLTKI